MLMTPLPPSSNVEPLLRDTCSRQCGPSYANKRRLERCEFKQGDFVVDTSLLGLGEPQVILLSGSLNTMTDIQIFSVLEAAWSQADEVLMFNFLSGRCGPQAPPQDSFARRLDTVHMIEWAYETEFPMFNPFGSGPDTIEPHP